MNARLGMDQYLVPYLMSSHPGSSLKEAVELAEHLRELGYMPEQVQDFYPTPSTISTCMYYTCYDCRTMEKVYVPKNPHEKAMQRALIQYRNPKNRELVEEALTLAGRRDLIGYGPKCLIRLAGETRPGSWRAAGSKRTEKGARTAGKRPERSEPAAAQGPAKSGRAGAKKTRTIRNVHKKKGGNGG